MSKAILTCKFVELVELGFGVELGLFAAMGPEIVVREGV